VQQVAVAMQWLLRDPKTDLAKLAARLTYQLRRNEEARIGHWWAFRRLPPRRDRPIFT
jgi:hypothetical protein